MEVHVPGPDQWEDLVSEILSRFPNQRIFLLTGDLGAGKTTLVKEFATQLGSDDTVQSPTFSIINEYDIPGGKMYHMDLYRLNSPEEVYDLGFEEYIASGSYCFIEWPEKAIPFIQESWLDITIDVHKETGRLVSYSAKNL